MLKIDYSLIPLKEDDRDLIQREVQRRVRNGQIPAVERALSGRVIVLNPDPVQTVHQIPDDLRPRLRRVLVPTQEGSTHRSAEALYRAIVESDERLYLLIIELQSEFKALNPFLSYIPQLREEYPGLAVFLSSTIPNLLEKFQQILSEGRTSLTLKYPDARGSIEIHSVEELGQVVSSQDEVLTFGSPFFSQVRLMLERNGRPVAFNVETLRALHPVFGHGEAEEVEVGGGRRERIYIVDLPMRLIRDFQFRPDRGMEFHGVVMGGEFIPSHQFHEKKLEYRWVPMRSVEAFVRRRSGAEQEKVETARIKVLRVNCFNGRVSLLQQESADRISLAAIQSAVVTRHVTAPPSNPQSDAQQPTDAVQIAFDQVIRPQTTQGYRDPMQEAVKDHFYGSMLWEGIEQQRKLELYAQRLNVGAVGPLAGQTLKLLRRFGLEQLIDPKSFHYLGDEIGDLADCYVATDRLEEHFTNLLELLRGLTVNQSDQRIRVADMAYHMPLSTEWVDTGLATYARVEHTELEAAYHEMRVLLDFITHEFRRNFDIDQEDITFFEKIRDCRTAGLLAKWLSEVKRGAYGKPLPEGECPDVVFYATEEDKRTGDVRYRFPSLACSELFNAPANRLLFRNIDYDFSVFLEEQLALAINDAREAGIFKPGLGELQNFFTRRLGEIHENTQSLNQAVEAFDDSDAPVYQQLLKQEEESYHKRYQEFVRDQDRIQKELAANLERYEKLVAGLQSVLDAAAGGDPAYFRDDPEHPGRREARILRILEKNDEGERKSLWGELSDLSQTIDEWSRWLERVPNNLGHLLKQHNTWQTAMENQVTQGLIEKWADSTAARMVQLRRLPPQERGGQALRSETQLRNLEDETQRYDARVVSQRRNLQRAVVALHGFVSRAKARMEPMRTWDEDFDPDACLMQTEIFRESLSSIAKTASDLAGKADRMVEALEQARVRKQRYATHLHQLRLEVGVLKALAGKEDFVPEPVANGDTATVYSEEQLQRLHTQWETHRQRLREVPGVLNDLEGKALEKFRLIRGHTTAYHRYHDKFEALTKLSARQRRLREAAQGLEQRQVMMDEELADLPQRVSSQFMPARKKLLVEVFIPEEEKRESQTRRAQAFVGELLSLSSERLKTLYLDRSIYRRFYGRQFVRGWQIATDSSHPSVDTLRNIPPSIKILLRTFRHNFRLANREEALHLELLNFPTWSVREMLDRFESMTRGSSAVGPDYMVLPATLPLRDAIALINRKDLIFKGVPRLVLIYVSKFDSGLLRTDAGLREAYFRALKHNVILNVDGHVVVDNPKAIAAHLLRETLGSAVDFARVEELSQDEAALNGDV